MTKPDTFVLRFLRNYHFGTPLPPQFSRLELAETDYLYDSGVAPFVFEQTQENHYELSSDQADLIRSAAMTSRVVYGQIRATLMEVLQLAEKLEFPIVLLKGVSVANRYYSAPHLRTMGDIDVLLNPAHAQELRNELSRHGYDEPQDDRPRTPANHHHLPEIRQPDTNIAVELHTSLISRTMLANEPLFNPFETWKHGVAAEFHGIRCQELDVEYQLLYTISHWAIDYKWPVNLISLNDVISMTRSTTNSIDWNKVNRLLADNQLVADILIVLLLFLRDAKLCDIPPELTGQVEKSSRRIGRINTQVLHWLILKFPLSGRRKVGWAITQLNARIIWLTLLEPRNSWARLPLAAWRVVSRRTHGKSLLGSTAGRIRTLLQPNG